jgi:hypothetical protein
MFAMGAPIGKEEFIVWDSGSFFGPAASVFPPGHTNPGETLHDCHCGLMANKSWELSTGNTNLNLRNAEKVQAQGRRAHPGKNVRSMGARRNSGYSEGHYEIVESGPDRILRLGMKAGS